MSSKKPTILALCAHPDDAEIKCGGTLILLAKSGWDVHIATLSAGDCGSAEEMPNKIAAQRRSEAQASAAMIGGTYHCLGGTDLQVFDDGVMRAAGVTIVREVRPDVIITHYPIDYMPDHEAASKIARMASFTASIANYVTGPAAAVPATDAIPALYYFTPLGGEDYFGTPIVPQVYIDVTSVADVKAEALGLHTSQREWLRRQHGMDQYIEDMRNHDADQGRECGATFAEGFIMHKGHAYPRTPIIENALPNFARGRK